jgi:hypothetical protein
MFVSSLLITKMFVSSLLITKTFVSSLWYKHFSN